MPLSLRQPVEITQNLTFGAQSVPAGTKAFVAQLSEIADGPVWVFVPSLRREVIVPQSVLKPIKGELKRVLQGTAELNVSAVCRFAVNDPVTLAHDRQYGNDHVPAGTKGKVTQVVALSVACMYWVRWSIITRDVMVPESDLL